MHLIKILFLSISVFFSFGFTTYQHICSSHEEVVEEHAHSCCDIAKNTVCTDSNDCKDECCLQPTDYFVLNSFVMQTESKEEITVLESIKKFNAPINLVGKTNLTTKRAKVSYYSLDHEPTGRSIISIKQSWLI